MTGTGPENPDEAQPLFSPGANALVVGGTDSEASSFVLSRLHDVDRRLLISTDTPATEAVATAAEDDPGSPLTVVDCTGEIESADAVDAEAEATVTVTGPEIPSVGEAAVATIDDLDPSATAGICVDSVSTLVARSTVQQTYKLLYVLARRVREGGHVAAYTCDATTEQKTLRIIGQALDYRVSMSGPDGPTVHSLEEVADGR